MSESALGVRDVRRILNATKRGGSLGLLGAGAEAAVDRIAQFVANRAGDLRGWKYGDGRQLEDCESEADCIHGHCETLATAATDADGDFSEFSSAIAAVQSLVPAPKPK